MTALWTSAEAEAATKGRSTRPFAASGVSIDSRGASVGDLFVALKGPRFDGHDFVVDAFSRGAAAAMVSRTDVKAGADAALLVVDDTMAGLDGLAIAARARTGARIIGITGSVGKTGTKEALRIALEPQGVVSATAGNLNNRIGVPLSLARMPRAADFGIFELGMSRPGEIGALSRLVRPHVAIITTIEPVHSEFFDSIADIADAKASLRDQAVIFKRKHNWIMCWLYLGTFGSFIGYAAGFPLLIRSQFPHVNALQYAWLGPLVGAAVRPFGGWLADRLGGAAVTFWNFVVMALAVLGVLVFLPSHGTSGSFAGFFAMFMLLFLTTGIGNGSTFRMIPIIFLTERQREAAGGDAAARELAVKDANKEAAAVLGFTSAVAAYGGFFIPKSYGTSIALTGGPQGALILFVVFYLTCIALTWWYYARRNAEMPC